MSEYLLGANGRRLLIAYGWLLILFIIVPALVLVPVSIGKDDSFVIIPHELSLRWYQTLFTDTRWRNALILSLKLAVFASVLATVAGVLAAIEFFADKIPFVDSAWDAVHTFIRIPAGIVLGAAALGQMDPTVTVLAGLAGGALAGTAHLAKAGSRALINTSPEPFSNVAASAGEDVSTVGGLALAFFLPAVFLVMLLIFVVLAWWWLPRVWRGWRSLLARVKGLKNDGVH